MNLLVGTGGWAYFKIPEMDSLEAYASTFKFVEVNNTYYEYPDPRMVYGWRKRVPNDFEFSVRCHRDIARGFQKNGDRIGSVVEKMEPICDALSADVLAVLVPSSVKVSDEVLSDKLDELLSTFHSKRTRVAVEFRNGPPSQSTIRALENNEAVQSADLSREEPVAESSIMYSRLFGKGEHNIYEFDDEELKTILSRASAPRFEKSILAFHGVRMYRDAGRASAYLNSGEFPKITDFTGLSSLAQVLGEDSVFPTSKSQLLDHQGWKLFDLTTKKRARARDYLNRLPDSKYETLDAVVDSLRGQFPQEASGAMTTHAKTQHSF